MNIEELAELFAVFGQAPMDDYLERLFEGVPLELKKHLIIEDVSYHRYRAEIVTLEAWMVIDSLESDKWIWACVESDLSHNTIREYYLTRDSYLSQELHSIEDCIEYYNPHNKK